MSSIRWIRAGAIAVLTLAWSAAAAPVRVTATVSMVADLARQVGGDRVEVTALMGPGVDPHLYKATATDLLRLQRADVILYCGLHLEGRMQEVLERMARSGRRVVPVAGSIPVDRLLKPSGEDAVPDPHVWFDVRLWSLCAGAVADALAQAAPGDGDGFRQRAAAYQARLDSLHAWAVSEASTVPAGRRVLVTSHDAFSYFGRAYGFEVVGLQGISTVTEAGLADMTRMVDFLRARNIPAVFIESSVSPAALERISRDAGVRIGGELFSDALGAPGQKMGGHDVGTYEGMFRHNLETVVHALR